ncbi:hypothetical protein V6N11_051019 [Hibiscus sabdariffa]|uniref:Uncharacterized protein n=1 Tax=Hibiscus sabdariffa TaxID=183260 RepID=A0ABR2R2R6_9ROSI
MKFKHAHYIEPIGIVEGLALWWTEDANISILRYGKNFIDSKLSTNIDEEWFCIFIYGPLYAEEKQKFWEGLSILRRTPSDKLCIIGDTNIVTRSEDKLGGALFDSSQAKHFLDFVDKEGLLELSIKGVLLCGPTNGVKLILFLRSWTESSFCQIGARLFLKLLGSLKLQWLQTTTINFTYPRFK